MGTGEDIGQEVLSALCQSHFVTFKDEHHHHPEQLVDAESLVRPLSCASGFW